MFKSLPSLLPIVAQAEKGPASWQQGIASFFPFILLFVVLYIMWIRPEQQRTKKHRELVKAIKAGDKVITTGGMHGTVAGVTERTVKLSLAPNLEVEFERAAIGRFDAGASAEKGS